MVLVTGGTGLVGSHLLYFLLKENDSVRAIHRKSSNLQSVKEVFSYYTSSSEELFNKIDWVEADITEVPSLSEAFKGITKVYHAAAYINFSPKNYHKLKKVNIEGTANVVNLCLLHKVEKLCYVSSIATLGETENDELISENTEWDPEAKNSLYSITKYGAEMEVWRGTQEGLNAVIVNPGIILGSGHWNSGSNIFLKNISKGIPFYTSGGIGIVDVRDVVRSMMLLMQSDRINDRFLLVSKSIFYEELFTLLANLLGKNPPKKKAPKWALLGFSKLDWISSKLIRTKRRLNDSTVHSLYKISFYDASKIEANIDFSYTPYSETLKRVAENYLKKTQGS